MTIFRNVAVFTCVYLLLTGCAIGFNWPTAKVDVVVVDEEGMPVEGANVVIGFSPPETEVRNEGARGLSDINGLFSARKTTTGIISYGATKEGYYKSYYEKRFPPGVKIQNPIEVTIVMRKILKPVPMYAMNNSKVLDVPVADEEVGFDLIHYDWVSPYGNGDTADLILKLKREYIDRRNYDASVTITFSDKYDGIQLFKEEQLYGSDFILPREAPQEGYKGKLVISKSRSEAKKQGSLRSFKQDDNYIFRVRSKIDESGNIKAMYGKIIGPIKLGNLSFRDTASISFKYYLNADYTKNLEFDPEQNLFGSLTPLEQVGIK